MTSIGKTLAGTPWRGSARVSSINVSAAIVCQGNVCWHTTSG